MHRYGQHVVGDLVVGVLVEVVTDAGPVRQEVFDRDVVADQRQVGAEHRTRGGRQVQQSLFDQAGDGERGQPLRPAGDREPGVDRVRDPVRAVRVSVRLGELELATPVHPHHTAEPGLVRDRVDRVRQAHHPRSVPVTLAPHGTAASVSSRPALT